jgi:hypothetical protein
MKMLGRLFYISIIMNLAFIITACKREISESAHERVSEVSFDSPIFDFGTIPQAKTINHTFRLINHGTNEMSVIMVKVSCTCTLVASNLTEKILPAKGELLVPITYNSGEREGQTESSVNLLLLNGQNRITEVKATIRGRVDPEFSPSKILMDFGVLFPGQSVTQTVVIRPHKMNIPPLLEGQTHFGPFVVNVHYQVDNSGAKSNSIVTVVFAAPPLMHHQDFSKSFDLATSSKLVPKITTNIKAEIKPEVEITPGLLVINQSDVTEESNFLLQSRQPSRVVRIYSKSLTNRGDMQINYRMRDSDGSGWNLAHRFQISNLELADATQINVELLIQRDAGAEEARLVSAEIKSLEH